MMTFQVFVTTIIVNMSEEGKRLCDLKLCRLCGEDSSNGYPLYPTEPGEEDLCTKINTYLPICIFNDETYPKWICPGCHLQLESTTQFLNLIIAGQKKLHQIISKTKLDGKNHLTKPSSTDASSLIEGEMPMEPLYSINQNIFTDITPKLKRKRGRPVKLKKQDSRELNDESMNETVSKDENILPNSTAITEGSYQEEEGTSDHRKRKIRIPQRYENSFQGKELERALLNIGVLNKSVSKSISIEEMNTFKFQYDTTCENDEIIGYIQDESGSILGDLISITGRQNYESTSPELTGKKTRFVCDICKLCFWQEPKYMQHRLSHTDIKYECTECLVTFKERNEFYKHQVESGHKGEGIIEDFRAKPEEDSAGKILQLRDNTSEKTFLDSNTLLEGTDKIKHRKINPSLDAQNQPDKKNISVKEGKVFSCIQCPKTFAKISTLLSHKKLDHNMSRKFVCGRCKREFRSKVLFQKHQITHSELKPYKCETCNAEYKTRYALTTHLTSHTGVKKYTCEVCNQKFVHKHSLKVHMDIHMGLKPHKCPICGKGFSQHCNMKEHVRIHTGERPFQCHVCEKRFKTSSQCRLHMARHQVVRTMQCNFCEKSFLSPEELKVHLRRHNNEKPFSCSKCSKCFTDLPGLRKHTKLHTGEKPFSCGICDRKFADRSNFIKHKKIHEQKDMKMKEALLTEHSDPMQSMELHRNCTMDSTLVQSQTSSPNFPSPSSNSLSSAIMNDHQVLPKENGNSVAESKNSVNSIFSDDLSVVPVGMIKSSVFEDIIDESSHTNSINISNTNLTATDSNIAFPSASIINELGGSKLKTVILDQNIFYITYQDINNPDNKTASCNT